MRLMLIALALTFALGTSWANAGFRVEGRDVSRICLLKCLDAGGEIKMCKAGCRLDAKGKVWI